MVLGATCTGVGQGWETDTSSERKGGGKGRLWSQQVPHHATSKHFLGTYCGRELGYLLYRHALIELL